MKALFIFLGVMIIIAIILSVVSARQGDRKDAILFVDSASILNGVLMLICIIDLIWKIN